MTKRFRSANIHEGMLRAPTRAFLQALGQDDDEIARPHIGVFHTGGEMSPCNMLLRDQALTMTSPDQLTEQLDGLLTSVEAVSQSVKDTDAILSGRFDAIAPIGEADGSTTAVRERTR